MAIRIKPLILEMTARCLPDFRETSSKRKGYWLCCDRNRPYYEFVVIGSSQKERVLGCDIAWGFFPTWDGAYGAHQMTASTGLPNLRLGSSAIPAEQDYYEHDGSEAGIRCTLDRIGGELATYALPWFRSRADDAGRDPLLQHGLDWVRAHKQTIPSTIHDDLRQAFTQASNRSRRVKSPVLEALKSNLRDFADKTAASPMHRKQIGILALHLLIHAGNSNENVT
jgi:hypothetical protein